MIVKDEEASIVDCLKSIPPGLIDYWVISDTGSTDKTKELIQSTLASIPGQLGNHKWVSFGANKSIMLEAARGRADYILMMDADHRLDLGGLNQLQVKELISSYKDVDQLMVRFQGHPTYYLPQLIRNNRAWKFTGVTHEYLEPEIPSIIKREKFHGFSIKDLANGSNRKEKFQRDIQLLEEGLKQEPTNHRYMYYLAQSYRDTGDCENALKYYKLRAEAGGFEEEAWHAQYQAMMMKTAEPMELVSGFIKAYARRPSRFEPLYHAIKICRETQSYMMGYMFGKGIPETLPILGDVLFIEQDVYDWGMPFEFGICAFYAGDFDIFDKAMDNVLKSTAPDNVKKQAAINLTFYRK